MKIEGYASIKVTVEGTALLSTSTPLSITHAEMMDNQQKDTVLLLIDARIAVAQAQARRDMIDKLRLTMYETRHL